MATPAEEAVEAQDSAAERFLPVAVAAMAAASTSPDARVPPGVELAAEVATFATLVSILSVLYRRSRPDQPMPPQDEIREVTRSISPEVAEEVWEQSKYYASLTVPDVGVTKAEAHRSAAKAVARSAATAASARATLAAAEGLGLGGYKVWISRGDPKVRSAHRKLHGRPVEIGRPFTTWPDGRVLDFPGDRRAPLDQWINCRCMLFVVPTKAGVVDALAPADLDRSFALAASLETRWENS